MELISNPFCILLFQSQHQPSLWSLQVQIMQIVPCPSILPEFSSNVNRRKEQCSAEVWLLYQLPCQESYISEVQVKEHLSSMPKLPPHLTTSDDQATDYPSQLPASKCKPETTKQQKAVAKTFSGKDTSTTETINQETKN